MHDVWVSDGRVQGEGCLSDMSWPQLGSSPDTGPLMINDVEAAVYQFMGSHTELASSHTQAHRHGVNAHGLSIGLFLQNTQMRWPLACVYTRGHDMEGNRSL